MSSAFIPIFVGGTSLALEVLLLSKTAMVIKNFD